MVPFWVNAVAVLPKCDRGLFLEDIFGEEHWAHIVLSNYMIDMKWMIMHAPTLARANHLTVISGEQDNSTILATLAAIGLEKKSTIISPSLPLSFGTHHSKFILCFNERGVRVVVTTANFICDDWTRKTQGIYLQDFPRRSVQVQRNDFRELFKEYLVRCKASVIAELIVEHDFDAALVDLVPSVPGYHKGDDLPKFGQARLRSLLRRLPTSASTDMLWQYTSQGSLTDSFLRDMQTSMMGADTERSANVRIVMPTEEQVRNSLEGWRGGFSIPICLKNCHEFVNSRLFKWGTSHDAPRNRAMPHIKSYARFDQQTRRIDWYLLTSCNLSRAAFGEFQKNGQQLAIRSYELGVLYHPGRLAGSANFSCTEKPVRILKSAFLVKHTFQQHHQPGSPHCISLPYDIFHLTPYASTSQLANHCSPEAISTVDVPWVIDIPHRGSDVLGQTMVELASYSHYGPTSWGAPTLHFETWRPHETTEVRDDGEV